jgi:hypothetical protein
MGVWKVVLIAALIGACDRSDDASCLLDGQYRVRAYGSCGEVTQYVQLYEVENECVTYDPFISCAPGNGRTYQCDGFFVDASGCYWTVEMNHVCGTGLHLNDQDEC